MKAKYIVTFGVVVLFVLAFAGSALAVTSEPTAPTVDVFAYATGIFSALSANLTDLLKVGGLMAGVFLVISLVRRIASGRAK